MSVTDWRNRIERRIAELGLSNADVCRLAGIKSSMLTDILGVKQATPSLENAVKICRAIGLTLNDLFQSGSGHGAYASLNGAVVGAGMWSEATRSAPERVNLDVLAFDLVWLRVETSDMRPAYEAGDVVGGPKTIGRPIHNLSGSECIVETADGQRLLRFVHPDVNRDDYILRSRDPSAEDVAGVRLVWAAPVRVILRGV
jgi:transcriptional regulator with XRE-family HTH domain